MVFIADIAAQEAVNKAAGVVQTSGEDIPMAAVPLFHLGPLVITNSALVSYVVAAIIITVSQLAMRNATLRPGALQNFVEWLVESLNKFLESILGPDLCKKTSWFFASVFIFILVSNWIALIPGVGTIGLGYGSNPLNLKITEPFIRGVNADVNMTLAISLIFFALWIVWTLQANGIWGTLLHIFGPKGGQTGVVGAVFVVIFLAVGVIEVISIMARPIALTFRLFGNIYGGEVMMEKTMTMVPALSWLIPLPVYFFESIVGFVQALVFFLLTAVFTAMICRHDDSQGKESHH
jgi:F-type H+-transporting ATPase subunit a